MLFLSYGSRCETITNLYGFGRNKSYIYCAVKLKGTDPSIEKNLIL